MQAHDRYTELCALAASAQLSSEEYQELNSHLEQCSVCRESLSEFRQVVCRELPQTRSRLAEVVQMARVRRNDGSREAFLQRARAEGVRFSEEIERRSTRSWITWRKLAPYAAVSVLSAAVTLSAYLALHPRVSVAPATTASTQQLVQLRDDNHALQARLAAAARLADSRAQEVDDAKFRLVAVAAQERELERLLRTAQSSAASLQSALASANLKNSDLDARLRQTSATVAQARSELDRLRTAKVDSEATLVAQQNQIQELSQKLRLETASVEMDKQLMAASRDVRDLMGARNLHITDVHDFDGHGKQSKVFGRIFYTEGKSLIFYAFDLGEKRLENAKYSFQAWGQKEGVQHSAKSLGLMYLDDKAQKRWVLKVDDPDLLRHIDSVFVTVEPAGGGKKPSGQKLMYAYLGNQPNHP